MCLLKPEAIEGFLPLIELLGLSLFLTMANSMMPQVLKIVLFIPLVVESKFFFLL